MLAFVVVQISDMIYPVTGDPLSARVHDVSAVLCTPTYLLRQATVSSQAAADDFQSLEVDTKGHEAQNITGISSWTPAHAFLGLLSITSTWQVFFEDPGDYLSSLVTDFGTRSEFAALAAPEILSLALTRLYTAFGAQMAKQSLITKGKDELPGTYSLDELRIVINSVTTRIVEATLALLMILTLLQIVTLWWSQLRLHLPANACDIATILAASADLKAVLANDIDLSDHEFCLSNSREPGISRIQIDAALAGATPKIGLASKPQTAEILATCASEIDIRSHCPGSSACSLYPARGSIAALA